MRRHDRRGKDLEYHFGRYEIYLCDATIDAVKMWNTILDAGLKHNLIIPVVMVDVLGIYGLITAAVINKRMEAALCDATIDAERYGIPFWTLA